MLAAPAALGGGRRAFTWPIDLLHDGDFGKDLLDLARLFAMKGWNRGVWEELVEGALKFVTSDRFTSTFSSVTGVLDHYPQLDARLLEVLERSLL